MMYGDGTIAPIENIEEKFSSDKQIFDDDLSQFMGYSQLGVCVSQDNSRSINFIPISKLMNFDERQKDISRALDDLGKKVKKLERGR